MRYSHQKLVSTLLTTLILVINCVSAEPKKKRVIIHVPETVKHVHHHITKKVPLPIVVFTKNPKEPKPYKEFHKEPYFLESKEPYYHEHKEPYHHKESYHHEPYHQHESYHHESYHQHEPYHHESYHHEPKESYYHEHKESYHHEPSYHEHKDSYHHEPSYHKESYHPEPSYHKESYHPEPSYHKESYHHEPGYHKESYGNEHGPGYEAEYEGSEHSYVTRGIRESDVHMARGVVADYHEAKPKVIKPASGAPLLHLTPPRHSKAAKTYDWGDKRRDEVNYGSFKSYVPPSPRPPALGQPGGKSQHYFHIGPPEPTTHGPSAAHAPAEGAVKKSKKKSRVGKRRVPHTLHDYDPTGGLALPTNQTPYTVNEFIEENFRR